MYHVFPYDLYQKKDAIITTKSNVCCGQESSRNLFKRADHWLLENGLKRCSDFKQYLKPPAAFRVTLQVQVVQVRSL